MPLRVNSIQSSAMDSLPAVALSLLFIGLTSCTESVSQTETLQYIYPSLEKLWEPFLTKLEASRAAPDQPCIIPL
jgi:hypothetical protein